MAKLNILQSLRARKQHCETEFPTKKSAPRSRDLSADPFHEHAFLSSPRVFEILGARFRFDSNSRALLDIVEAAYAHVPPQRFARNRPELRVSLRLLSGGRLRPGPPRLELMQGAGYLLGAGVRSNCVVISPEQRSAVVVLTPAMLRYPYHLRYEFVEFAVFTLAARAQNLLALHGACVGWRNRGLLIVGDSGAGKSTIALHSMLAGLELLSEDSVFIQPRSLLATGVPNFVHMRPESLRLIDSADDRALVSRAPVIRRRSGVTKLELDTRQARFKLAKRPMHLSGIVFLSSRPARGSSLLSRLSKSAATKRLASLQPYAGQQPEWPLLRRRLAALECVELARGSHPRDSVAALRSLLAHRP